MNQIFFILFLTISQLGCKSHPSQNGHLEINNGSIQNSLLNNSINSFSQDSILYRAYIINSKEQPINDAHVIIKNINGDTILSINKSENLNGYYYFTIPNRIFAITVKYKSIEQNRIITENNIPNDKKFIFFFGDLNDSLFYECSAISGCYLKPFKLNKSKIGIVLSKEGINNLDLVKSFLDSNDLLIDTSFSNSLSKDTYKYILYRKNELLFDPENDSVLRKIRTSAYFNTSGVIANLDTANCRGQKSFWKKCTFSMITNEFRISLPNRYISSLNWEIEFEKYGFKVHSILQDYGTVTYYVKSFDLGIGYAIISRQKELIDEYYYKYNLKIFQNY